MQGSDGLALRTTIILLHRGGSHLRGTEACVLQTARALHSAGYSLVVARNDPVMDEAIREISPDIAIVEHRFPELMVDGLHSTLPVFAYVRALFRLRKLVVSCRASMIYCSGGLPCQQAALIGKLQRIPVLCHFHHPAIKRAYYLWLVRYADAVIFPSEFTKRHSELKAKVTGTVIYNGVNTARFSPIQGARPRTSRAALGIPEDAVVLGQVGQLAPNKRPEFLVEALSKLLSKLSQPLHLCLVGAGELEQSLRHLVQKLGLERHVTLTGYVPDVLHYFTEVFDINALVSREEGLGISAIEGSSCGLPLLVARCTGLAETVQSEITGFAFEPYSMSDFCEKAGLLANDRELRKKMGSAGRLAVLEKFDSAKYDAGMVTVVRSLLSRRFDCKWGA